MRRAPSYVYLIEAANGLYKIGKTINIHSRFNNLQSSSPVRLRLLASRKMLWVEAYALEKLLHRRYKVLRQHGEWFQLDVTHIEEIMQGLRQICLHYARPIIVSKSGIVLDSA